MQEHPIMYERRRNINGNQGDDCVGMLSINVINGWPATKAEAQKEVQLYWSFQDEIEIIGGIDMKEVIIIRKSYYL